MNIEMPTVGVGGRFRLLVEGPNGKRDTGWFNNLITDSGMNRLGETNNRDSQNIRPLTVAQSIFGRFVLGGGSAEPRPTDTDLAAFIVRAPGDIREDSHTCNYGRGYYEFVCRYQFGEGVAAGNISEIGLQPSGKPLWCRALVLDAEGNPTTITVRSNEFLTVYYAFRILIPKQDYVYNINVKYNDEEVPTKVTIRPIAANQAQGDFAVGWSLRAYGDPSYNHVRFYSGGLSEPTATWPLGTSVDSSYTSQPVEYIPGSFKSAVKKSVPLGHYNNVDLATFLDDGGQGNWQINFDPPLRKTNDQRMYLTTRYSWERANVSE